jgi:hypothetical protein
MIWHQVQALSQVPGLSDIVLIGVYEDSVFATFLKESKREFLNVNIRSASHPYRPFFNRVAHTSSSPIL